MYICVKPEILEHSAKGQTWKTHKYIAIKNGRYIYPEDVAGVRNARQLEKEGRMEMYDKIGQLKRSGINVVGAGYSKDSKTGEVSVNAYVKGDKKQADMAAKHLVTPAGNHLNSKEMRVYRQSQQKSDQQRQQQKATVKANKKAEQEAMKQVQAKQQQKRAAAKANKQAEASKRQSEKNQQSARSGKRSDIAKELNKRDARKRTNEMHDYRSVESGNVVTTKYGQKSSNIYRKSDVDQASIMAYSKKYGFEKAVKEFGEKGKAFLLSIFGKK